MRETASQQLPRDSGESIFAARHQDVSQVPLSLGTFAPDVCLLFLLLIVFSLFCLQLAAGSHF